MADSIVGLVKLTMNFLLSRLMSTKPMMSQTTKVKMERRITVGTKYPESLSANFWIGAWND